jgi:lipoprotein-anchoring transpeptidase ErfK/SrfK
MRQIKGAEQQIARFATVFFLLVLAVRESQAQTQTQTAESTGQHRRKVVVSVPHRKLALIEDGKVKRVFPVAVGAEKTPSPAGSFEVKTLVVKPTYYHPGKVIPAGDSNPLGTRWIGLSTKGYGIHGTNVESSIGKAASHGCIRMHRKDLEELFASMQVGDQVEIRDEADSETAAIFGDAAGTDGAADGTKTAPVESTTTVAGDLGGNAQN